MPVLVCATSVLTSYPEVRLQYEANLLNGANRSLWSKILLFSACGNASSESKQTLLPLWFRTSVLCTHYTLNHKSSLYYRAGRGVTKPKLEISHLLVRG